jgi:hypothetical protein
VTWFKVDDKLHEHKKVRRMGHDLAAVGLWTLCGSWAGGERTDGFVPASIPRRWTSPSRVSTLANKLVVVGMWEPAEVDGEQGWTFHDWEDYNPLEEDTSSDVGRRRWSRKNALSKNRDLRERVQTRDRSMCRYCAVRVDWANKRGPSGGTYDHVDPEGDNSFGNVVVACRRCNGRKRDRTPDEAGMPLLPVPGPYVAPESTPESTPEAERFGSDLATPTRDGAESGRSRVGAGSGHGPESGRVPGPAPDEENL